MTPSHPLHHLYLIPSVNVACVYFLCHIFKSGIKSVGNNNCTLFLKLRQVIDDLTAADMVKVYNAQGGDQLVILSEAMTTEPYAFAMAFGSEDTIEAINGILKTMEDSGAIAAIFDKYEAPFTAPAEG